jgi:hypothetical protein
MTGDVHRPGPIIDCNERLAELWAYLGGRSMTAAAEIAAWLAASSQNDRSPKGDLVLRGPFGELVTVGLDDVPPEAPAGCLLLFTLAPGYVPTWGEPLGQQRLADRAQHVAWLAGAGRPDFPPVAVLRVAAGATMRQACTAAGIDPDAPLVGIPAAAF